LLLAGECLVWSCRLSSPDSLPIIFIIGQMDEQISAKAIKAGAINFFQKPFSNEDLLEGISEVFSKTGNASCRFAQEL
jgi:FixJ family two-component response regulator